MSLRTNLEDWVDNINTNSTVLTETFFGQVLDDTYDVTKNCVIEELGLVIDDVNKTCTIDKDNSAWKKADVPLKILIDDNHQEYLTKIATLENNNW